MAREMASFMAATCRRMVWPERGDRLLGELVWLGKAHRDLGHGRGHQPQFLGAPDKEREEPENRDRDENGEGGGERRRVGEEIGQACRIPQAATRSAHRRRSRRSRTRPMTQTTRRETAISMASAAAQDQAADRGQIVVGGRCRHPARRWTCRAAARLLLLAADVAAASPRSAVLVSSILGSGVFRCCSALSRSAREGFFWPSLPEGWSSAANGASSMSPAGVPLMSNGLSPAPPAAAPADGVFACSCAITRPSHRLTLRKLAPCTRTSPPAARAS